MTPFDKLKHGMGIGGWMTNYKRARFLPPNSILNLTVGDKEHFERYITRWDIQNIRSFGMDHIRIPFDQCVIEDNENPFTYREDMLQLLDRVIRWSLEEGFEVVLNLHHAIGCYCDFPEATSLLDDASLQERMIGMWEMLEDRYHDNDIIFEILNEITSRDTDAWNDLATRCVGALRAKNPTRRIIVGTAAMNCVDCLPDLKIFDDEYVGYTFHYYCVPFTHQRSTNNALRYMYNREMPWPGELPIYQDYFRHMGEDEHKWDRWPVIGRDYLEHSFQPVFDWQKAHPDKFLWFGEFGTGRNIRKEWRLNYMRDVISIMEEHNVPFCSWNYLSTPYDCNKFSLVDDDDRHLLYPEFKDILLGKVD